MTEASTLTLDLLDPRKFRDPDRTADGQKRASVALGALETLWFNTGTLCNLTCSHCYIDSSPTNDSLVYLSATEVIGYLDEIAADGLPTREIGFTGGEPFMNPEILAMLEAVLEGGFQALVLTNAMRPMMKCAEGLAALEQRFGSRLAIRVSVDHYTRALHEVERGKRSWDPMIDGLAWLSAEGFNLRVAGRSCWGEPEAETRKGYARLFAELGLAVDAGDPEALVIFPEMDAELDVPEITEACWDLLGASPDAVMCASSRMVVKRKGEVRPVVVPCTLLPYGDEFVMGETLAEADGRVKLNHPHCARFCVLGGGSCSKITDGA
ncbi:MAG: radical SAM protein [Rhodospirillales bacterium]|nr:radical SAM protein [Rhodospirillales bacterium]MDH3790601.1 radical SAM protein [Rhodospirillales bacterium]